MDPSLVDLQQSVACLERFRSSQAVLVWLEELQLVMIEVEMKVDHGGGAVGLADRRREGGPRATIRNPRMGSAAGSGSKQEAYSKLGFD